VSLGSLVNLFQLSLYRLFLFTEEYQKTPQTHIDSPWGSSSSESRLIPEISQACPGLSG